MGSILGGSQTSKSSIPAYLEDASKYTLGRSQDTSQIGYTPYYGPDVAALSPLEESGMRNTASAASAFGMQTPQSDPMAQINGTTGAIDPSQYANPEQAAIIQQAYRDQLGRDPDAQGFDFWMNNYDPETFQSSFAQGVRVDPLTGLSMPGTTNGVRGYSSAPMHQSAVNQLQERRPGQYDALMAQFINPQTGEASQYQQQYQQQQEQAAQSLMSAFTPDYGGAGDQGYGGGGAGGNAGGGMFGGYSGLGDMTDGGGPGKSGSTYGGALGGISNGLGKSPNESGNQGGGMFGGGGFFGGLFG